MEQRTSKISFRAWTHVHALFKERLKEACLQRDPYLDIVLCREARELDKEVPETNSEKARKYIKQSLQRLDATPISLALSNQTVELINDVCERKRIPRDSFINRVLLFLLMRRVQFSQLLSIDIENIIREEVLSDFGSDMAFDSTVGGIAYVLQSVKEDPFWVIRECINRANQNCPNSAFPLHQAHIDEQFTNVVFPKKNLNLAGLNCHVEDYQIEGTPEYDKWISMFDDFLAPDERMTRKREEA